MNKYATFIGWQEDLDGYHFPLFNIQWEGNPSNGSTVDANTILRIGLKLPEVTPCPYELKESERVEPQNAYTLYKNQDNRCTYPFKPEKAGYCYAYATSVDNGNTDEFVLKTCPKCELWKGEEL